MRQVPATPWPNLFVVGAPRSGTTSLYHYLAQHPEVFVSPLKEPHFFSRLAPTIVPYVKNEADYLALFEAGAAFPVRAEASPSYLSSPLAPAAIRRASPAARTVAILRDPVDRAHSAYWHRVRYGVETRTFEEVVAAELSEVGEDPNLPIVKAGLYASSLERYREVFGEAFLVLLFDELESAPAAVLSRTLAHVGLDPTVPREVRFHVRNAFALPRNALARRIYRSRRVRTTGRDLVPYRLHLLVERLLLRGGSLPPMAPRTRATLEEAFRDDVERVERILERPLPWSPSR